MSKPISMSALSECGYCHRNDIQLKRCSGCNEISYCSKECQRKAWKTHKVACRVIQNNNLNLSKNKTEVGGRKYTAEIRIDESVEGIIETMKSFSAHPEFVENNLALIVRHRYFPSVKIPEQYKGYGLQKNPDISSKLLQERDLVQLLPHIWAEENSEYRILWLKEVIRSFAHPVLYLELARFLDLSIQTAKDKNSVLAESVAMSLIHDLLICIDLQCFHEQNQSRDGFVSYFMKVRESFQNNSLSEQEKKDIFPFLKKILSDELQFLSLNSGKLVHPSWLSKLTLSEPQEPKEKLVKSRPLRIDLMGKKMLVSFLKNEEKNGFIST